MSRVGLSSICRHIRWACLRASGHAGPALWLRFGQAGTAERGHAFCAEFPVVVDSFPFGCVQVKLEPVWIGGTLMLHLQAFLCDKLIIALFVRKCPTPRPARSEKQGFAISMPGQFVCCLGTLMQGVMRPVLHGIPPRGLLGSFPGAVGRSSKSRTSFRKFWLHLIGFVRRPEVLKHWKDTEFNMLS